MMTTLRTKTKMIGKKRSDFGICCIPVQKSVEKALEAS